MEAISEDWADANGACCCCSLGRLPGLISFNNAWTLRWLAWEVTVGMYVVDGYSISDNSAVNMLQVGITRKYGGYLQHFLFKRFMNCADCL
jgi:hypothetical protein